MLSVVSLKNVLKNRKFTISAEMQKQMDEYEENNNPLLLFLKEEEPEVENQTTQSVYKAYKAFCIANGFQSVSHMEFTKQIKKKYKVEVDRKRVDGKQVRMYVRK